ncbi:MAG TPA: class I SAM-dependent methyltransferase [Thermoplasmata archaeon]|nr:class I SAM-dependent methyltransferase [Thermoplasmata archaeon]
MAAMTEAASTGRAAPGPSTGDDPLRDAGLNRVRDRYRRLALFYPLLEPLLALPWGARRAAADALHLVPGTAVLEVGCGTGRNLPYLLARVGPTGRVYGVDATEEMLTVARRWCAARSASNVTLSLGDALEYRFREPLDALLFSLSYSVIPSHRAVLDHVWRGLKPGGRLVVLDANLGTGARSPLLRPYAELARRYGVLGDPDRSPWDDLLRLTPLIETRWLWGGPYFVCAAQKPVPETV